jgi:hypothetical protein
MTLIIGPERRSKRIFQRPGRLPFIDVLHQGNLKAAKEAGSAKAVVKKLRLPTSDQNTCAFFTEHFYD